MKKRHNANDVFDLFFANSIDLLCIADTNGNFIKLNTEWERTLGYQLSELEGRPYITFVHPDDVEQTSHASRQLAGNQPVANFVNRYRHKDGTYRWIEWRSYPLNDMVYASARDITDRIEMEQALKASEEKLRFIVDNTLTGIFTLDDAFRIIWTNNGFFRITGFIQEEIQGTDFRDLLLPESRHIFVDLFNAIRDGGKASSHTELELICRNKEKGWVEIILSVITDNDRSVTIMGQVVETTQRKLAEDKIKKSEERLRKAQLLGHIGYSEQLMAEDRIWASAEAMKIYGLPAVEGYVSYEQIRECTVDLPAFRKALADLFEHGKRFDLEFAINPADGSSQRYIHAIAELEKDSEGKPYKLLSIFQDITDHKKAEDALQNRVLALTKPLDDPAGIDFTDLFNIDELQKIQDTFADATGVASIITYPDGRPITKPSHFCRFCNIIRATGKGALNCMKSDAYLGSKNTNEPTISLCLSGGLWDAGTNITLGGVHLANWFIGQVRNEAQQDEEIIKYADVIGADREALKEALAEVPQMSKQHFEKISQALSVFTKELSLRAYQNIQQARFISEQKKTEEALKKSEEQFRTMAQNIPGVVFQCVTPGEGAFSVKYVSNLAEKYLGLNSGERDLFLRRFFDGIADEDKPGLLSSVAQSVSDLSRWEWEGKYIRPDGTLVYLGGNAQPRKQLNEIIFDGVLYDITERKVAEERNRRKAERAQRQHAAIVKLTIDKTGQDTTLADEFRMLTEVAAEAIDVERVGVWMFSKDKTLLICNDLFERTGRRHTHGMVLQAGNYPAYISALGRESRVSVSDARNDMRTKEFTEGYMVPADIYSMLDAIISIGGDIAGVVCIEHTGNMREWESDEEAFVSMLASLAVEIIIRDERKKAEEALKHNEELLAGAQHIAKLGSFEIDLIHQTGHMSFEMYDLLKLDISRGVPPIKEFLNAIHPDDRHLIERNTKDYHSPESQRAFEYRSNPEYGPIRYFLSRNKIVLDPETNTPKLIGTIQDITENKMAEAEILKLNQELEKKVEERTSRLNDAVKDLESFAYSVSHDLRAPIRHIDGFTKLLFGRIEHPDEIIKGYFDRIEGSTRRMSAMINSLLSFSRLGRKELTLSEVDLSQLMAEIIDIFKPDTEQRRVVWEVRALPCIHADRDLIKLAFENLISNAVKYTLKSEKAVIEIGSRIVSDSFVEIYIKDNGIGFDMAYASKLFGVFQRLHMQDDFEGVGIGLANARQIIEKHKGSIRAEGKINEGAVFYVTLPKNKNQ
jgi:PAS domain S-box-containing protein